MSLIKWEPFGDVDRFFNDFPGAGFPSLGRDMAVDLYEDGSNIVAEMSLSGIDPEKIDVTVESGYLRIAGSREETSEKKEKQFYSKEITRGSFERTLRLPDAVQEDAVVAEYEKGVLKITMPKAGEKKKEKIKVNVKG